MKNINYNFTYLLSFIFFVSINICCEDHNRKIVGGWVGNHNNFSVEFNFYDNKTCTIILQDTTNTNNIEKISGNYIIDKSKKPIPLTIKNIPEYSHPIHCIIEFNDINSIVISKFVNKWKLRPININYKQSFNLKRVNYY